MVEDHAMGDARPVAPERMGGGDRRPQGHQDHDMVSDRFDHKYWQDRHGNLR
jgi:hypothetical protein